MSTSGDIFDTKKLRRLVELMNEHELDEIDLRDGATRVRLRKNRAPVVTTVASMPMAAAPAPARGGSAPVAPAAAEENPNVRLITSPMIGTFFSSPSPENPAFVKVGDHVGKDTTVCIIEAMKVFNEIPSEVAGKIVAVLVENGAPVEFGQPLFRVDTSG